MRNAAAVLWRTLAVVILAGFVGGAGGNVAAQESESQYGCSPVSEELSALPAMENRVYAEWEGKIYYRQYSDEEGTAKELMCMEPDGSVTQAGVDDGCDEQIGRASCRERV